MGNKEEKMKWCARNPQQPAKTLTTEITEQCFFRDFRAGWLGLPLSKKSLIL